MADTNDSGLDRTEHLKLIRDMAVEASDLAVVPIPTVNLGVGLPATAVPVAFDRKDQRLISLKSAIEEFRQDPSRRKGTATVTTLKSFIDLTNRHKDDDSAIFAQTAWPEPKLTAVIDYHTTAHAARWGNHRVEYAFPLTEEFKAWVGLNAKPMEQADFAAFLEEHAAELAAPSDAERNTFEPLFKERFAIPSEVIQLSRHLEVNVGASIKRQERLQTGERVVEFTSEHTNAKGEKVDIPGIFMVSVPAFVDGDPVRIPARLRYRVKAGEIVWFYQLYRWEFWLREQVSRDLADAAQATKLPAFEGAAERG